MKNKPVKANKLAIDVLPARHEKYEVSVVGHRGLIVRVWPSGERTFVYRHRQDGQLRRLALKATTLGAAVAEWAGERRDAHAGVDVVSRRHDDRSQKKLKRVTDRRDPTVAALIERYVDEHAKRHKRSWSADESLLNRFVFPDLGGLKAKAIKRADVHSLVHKVARKTPTQANRLLAVVRKLFSFAVDAGVVDTHPCLRMKAPAPENARQRVLTDDEIRVLWNAPPEVLDRNIRDALKLQLLTACRVGEVIAASAEEFDLTRSLWIIPGERTKNGLPHAVPLSPAAEAIVRSRLDDGYLFPWPTKARRTLGQGRKQRLGCLMPDTVAHQLLSMTSELGMEHFTTHDLRRTAATRLGDLGFSKETKRRILNHKDTSVLGVHYDVRDGLREKQDALNAWARKVEEITTGVSPQVIEMKRRRPN